MDGRMNRVRWLLVAAMGLAVSIPLGCHGDANPKALDTEQVGPVVSANTRFAVTMYKRLLQHKVTVQGQGNLFFSPYSISTALAMTWAGANGQTEQDMGHTLGFDKVRGGVHALLGTMQQKLNQGGGKGTYQLSVANALWGQKGEPFLADYLNLVEQSYKAGLQQVDFVRQTEQARTTINKWVEDKTQDKIKDLIPRGAVSRDTVLVLTNAIYFKGDWAEQFDEKATREQPFHVTSDKSVQVPLMYQKGKFSYRELDGVQILELPYKGNDLSMVVLLPSEESGLTKLEEELSVEKLDQWLDSARKTEVLVYLPKFKMEWGVASLKDDLAGMGMGSAFGGADFSGINGKRNLVISDVVHKAFVEVNEEGTEAAAATGVIMTKGAVMRRPVFKADRPFMFVIRDTRLNSVLFMGRVVNPQTQSK